MMIILCENRKSNTNIFILRVIYRQYQNVNKTCQLTSSGPNSKDRFCRQFGQRRFWPKILNIKRINRQKKIVWWKFYRIRQRGFIIADSSLVLNTKLLRRINFQKAKFEKFGSEEAKVALCLFTLQSNSCVKKI